ncbi:hypothetical protein CAUPRSCDRAFT_13171 [Caulochytrium protostelioides]|uniref:Uncharacterized protein n=1 Tax=Caulochytrium protostelioides TaxID=1555241 RepID=A0A4P9WR50_9FUNG|nr:hypothetical protein CAUPRSCDRAFT_13171 [Caulochytrium protostelioides]
MFTTIDGANWSNYISRVYGFQTHELPRLLVGDPHADAYWDVDADGNDLVDRLGSLGAPTDPLMQALTDVLVGKVPGKSTGSFVDRVLRRFARAMAPVVHAYTTHPVWMTLFMLLAIGGGLFVCLGLATPADYRPVRNDPKAD